MKTKYEKMKEIERPEGQKEGQKRKGQRQRVARERQ